MITAREREIIRLVAKGHTNRDVADTLKISKWTVSTHLRRVFVKLGVRTRAQMVAKIYSADASKAQPTARKQVVDEHQRYQAHHYDDDGPYSGW